MKQTKKETIKLIAAIIFLIGGGICILQTEQGNNIVGWGSITLGVLALVTLILQKMGVGPLIQPKDTLPSPQSEQNGGEALIRVRGVDEEQLKSTIDDFIELYSDNAQPPSRPLMQSSSDGLLLSFPQVNGMADIDFEMFCYWVNYIAWNIDDKKTDVMGWYKMGGVKPQKTNQVIGQRTLCLFVPADDTEGDNIYFVTKDGICCKHSFAGLASLHLISPSPRKFEPMPA